MFENFQNIARFAQLQFKGMNVGTFSIKWSILVSISATVIEILTFNTWCTARESVTSTTVTRLVEE